MLVAGLGDKSGCLLVLDAVAGRSCCLYRGQESDGDGCGSSQEGDGFPDRPKREERRARRGRGS